MEIVMMDSVAVHYDNIFDSDSDIVIVNTGLH